MTSVSSSPVMVLNDYCFDEDVTVPYRMDEGLVTLSTFFSGKTRSSAMVRNDSDCLEVLKPCDMATFARSCEGFVHIAGGETVRNVDVVIDMDLLQEMTIGDPRFFGLHKGMREKGGVQLLGTFRTTPKTRIIATQIFSCTLKDSCRRIFMEGKALEFIAAFLERIGPYGKINDLPLTRTDVERIHEARRLLQDNMVDPPSLGKLARSVGINQFKLKKGFHAVYGCTVFQTLRKHRMETAMSLLTDTDMTVGTVAAMVGYTNMSHFIDCFRREYGVTPGAFLGQLRRDITP